ncbi:MAG TPA: GxxExxY protein [Tepidisphaeraceae bacterium]|nr:GxxExxY protein [Tepidisphaeraceae bacterium]
MDVFDFRKLPGPGVDEKIELLAHAVIGAAIEVHRILGPGLPETVYKRAVSRELSLRQIPHQCEFPIPIIYKGEDVGLGKIDILVAGKLVIELKAVDALCAVHRAQVVTYLQVRNERLGILINFNVAMLRDGIKRVLNPNFKP